MVWKALNPEQLKILSQMEVAQQRSQKLQVDWTDRWILLRKLVLPEHLMVLKNHYNAFPNVGLR